MTINPTSHHSRAHIQSRTKRDFGTFYSLWCEAVHSFTTKLSDMRNLQCFALSRQSSVEKLFSRANNASIHHQRNDVYAAGSTKDGTSPFFGFCNDFSHRPLTKLRNYLARSVEQLKIRFQHAISHKNLIQGELISALSSRKSTWAA